MARPLRLVIAGGMYHITSRGNERHAIYRDNRDREQFFQLLSKLADRFDVEIIAYVLMDNHYHLFIQTLRTNLSQAIQWLNVSYGVWFNRRHRRCGHLFQGRFGAQLIDPERVLSVVDYIHLNPARVTIYGFGKRDRKGVEAGNVKKVKVDLALNALRECRWSSFWAYSGIENFPAWISPEKIQDIIAVKLGRPYRERIEQRVKLGMETNPWEELKGGLILGSKEFVIQMQKMVQVNERAQFRSRELYAAPSWEVIAGAVEQLKGMAWKDFVDQHGDWGRDIALLIARRRGGLTLRELGDRVGVASEPAIFYTIKRMEEKIQTVKELKQAYDKICQIINNKL